MVLNGTKLLYCTDNLIHTSPLIKGQEFKLVAPQVAFLVFL